MTGRTGRGGVTRRGFLLALAAACAVRRGAGIPLRTLEDACVRRAAAWAG